MKHTCRYQIGEKTQVNEARRDAQTLAIELGFNETASGRVAIIVTELGNNILTHARKGEILLRALKSEHPNPGIEILSLDSGPGIKNISECMRDGYSTAGTAGTGLGAVRRMSHTFDLYSLEGKGTVVLSQLWANLPVGNLYSGPFQAGVDYTPHPAEKISGDVWLIECNPKRALVLIADGLGHGFKAAEAANLAARVVCEKKDSSISEIVHDLHESLRSTRGAALSIAEVDLTHKVVNFVGIGNVMGAVLTGSDQRRMVTMHGTVGHQIYKIQSFSYPWPTLGGVLIMHSDGLSTKCCDLEAYPGLILKNPGVIAGVLYRDFNRGNDDSTLVVVREGNSKNKANE